MPRLPSYLAGEPGFEAGASTRGLRSLPIPSDGELSQSPASQVALVVKNPTTSAGDVRDVRSIPGLGRSPGGGPGIPLHYSCLESPMDRGAWRATVHGVEKSWTKVK